MYIHESMNPYYSSSVNLCFPGARHKDELFEWVRAKLGSKLRVVLIANRSDSKERECCEWHRKQAMIAAMKRWLWLVFI